MSWKSVSIVPDVHRTASDPCISYLNQAQQFLLAHRSMASINWHSCNDIGMIQYKSINVNIKCLFKSSAHVVILHGVADLQKISKFFIGFFSIAVLTSSNLSSAI